VDWNDPGAPGRTCCAAACAATIVFSSLSLFCFYSFPDGISLLKLDNSPPAPSTAASTDATAPACSRPSSRGGLACASAAGMSSSLVSLDAGTPSQPIAARPVTPRAAAAVPEASKKFDSGSGGMVPLAAEGRPSTASVPIGLGLHLLRPMSSSRGHVPSLSIQPHSAGLAGVLAGGHARPVTPKGPLTALGVQQPAAATAAASAVGSIPFLQVSSHSSVFFTWR
jgi:hypothetical protein